MSKTNYSNWYTKLLLGKAFERQHFIPIPPSRIEQLLIKTIEKTKFSKVDRQIAIDKPIFIIGLPRSGTTMLYNLLCAHASAAYITNTMNSYPASPRAIDWLCKSLSLNISGERFFNDSVITDFQSPSEPIMFWGKWMGRDVDSLFWNEQRLLDLPEGKEQEIKDDIKKIISCFGNTKRFICKYPIAQTELKIIQDLFPDVRFIHIIRDGRQVANSLIKLNKISNNQLKKIKHPSVDRVVTYPRVSNLAKYIEKHGANSIHTTAQVWRDSIELVEEKRSELNHYMEVKYEDILQNPLIAMEKIFEFCELTYPESTNAKYKNLFENIGSVSHKNNYGEFNIVEQYASGTLAKYGYL